MERRKYLFKGRDHGVGGGRRSGTGALCRRLSRTGVDNLPGAAAAVRGYLRNPGTGGPDRGHGFPPGLGGPQPLSDPPGQSGWGGHRLTWLRRRRRLRPAGGRFRRGYPRPLAGQCPGRGHQP